MCLHVRLSPVVLREATFDRVLLCCVYVFVLLCVACTFESMLCRCLCVRLCPVVLRVGLSSVVFRVLLCCVYV